MHRFYTTDHLQDSHKFTEGKIFHQISHVFRGKKGDRFVFFGNGGADTVYEISDIKKKEISLTCVEKKDAIKKMSGITVFQAFPNKVQTMEFIVQKLVEIGVKEIIFFRSDRSQVADIPQQKQERIQIIAIEALEQSGNNSLPVITYSDDSIGGLLNSYSTLGHIVGSPNGQDVPKNKKSADNALWIGPEGGWSREEIHQFETAGCTLWSFSKSILRLETATIVGAGILTYFSAE